MVVAGKAAAAWMVGARYGFSRGGRLMMLSLTMPQAAATLAITVAGQQAGMLEAEVVDAVIIVILLSCSAGTLLTHFVARKMSAQEAG